MKTNPRGSSGALAGPTTGTTRNPSTGTHLKGNPTRNPKGG
jgi:hypothetical protein